MDKEGFVIYFHWDIYFRLYGAENYRDQISRITSYFAIECRGKYTWKDDVCIVKAPQEYALELRQKILDENEKRRVERYDVPMPVAHFVCHEDLSAMQLKPNITIDRNPMVPIPIYSWCEKGVIGPEINYHPHFLIYRKDDTELILSNTKYLHSYLSLATVENPLIILGFRWTKEICQWDEFIIKKMFSDLTLHLAECAKISGCSVFYNEEALRNCPSLSMYPKFNSLIDRLEKAVMVMEDKENEIVEKADTKPTKIYSTCSSFRKSEKK